jgi:NADH-quinone oxidoreductase subunit N
MNIWISTFERSLIGILPELFLFAALSALLLFGAFTSEKKKNLKSSIIVSRLVGKIRILILIITILIIINRPFESQTFFHNRILINPFIQITKLVIVIGRALLIWISLDYIKTERINAFEYIILKLFACLGMMLLISSQDLIVFYLAIEIQRLSLYALAAFNQNSAFSTESGLKYFILGAFSSGLLLFGASMIYGFRGTTNFEELTVFFSGIDYISPGLCLGIFCLRAALLFKISAAPFHAWAPDVYEGAPISVTAFFSILPKFAVIIFCCRFFFFTFYDMFNIWQPIILCTALISIVVAAFSALYQRKLKRFLAYSSIGHVGYMLLAFGTGTSEGLQSILVYIFIYLITSICVWSFILSLNLRKDNKNKKPFFISELNGLGVSNPLLAFTLTVIIFSIAGTPPLAGFIAKLNIFFCAIESSLFVLSFLGIITSCLSAFYYLRFIKIMYFDASKSWTLVDKIDKDKSIFIGASLFFLVLLFIFPSPLFILSHEIAVWVLV